MANPATLNLIRNYLPHGRMMQVATVNDDGQPWVCTVYYVEDEEMNLYWLSLPTRRHSMDISQHNEIAITVPLKVDKPVVGIQAEGRANAVADRKVIERVMKNYVDRYNSGQQFYERFIAGENQHVLFRFKPSKFVLFDEVTFPSDGRQEVDL
jgi:uncharacterized protein YhbP (UPF0306 family)